MADSTTLSPPRGCRCSLMAITGLMIAITSPVAAQIPTEPLRPIQNNSADIRIDGQMDEAVWQSLPFVDAMQVVDPDRLEPAANATRTRLLYSERGLYIGIEADQLPATLLARLSSRDADINRDGVTVYLDTSGEGRYGYYFGVNLGGTLIDGTLLPERQMSSLWDGPWLGAASETATGYQVEMFLPWSMMNMPATASADRNVAIAVTRRVAGLDETWGWPALPESQARFMSGMQSVVLQDLGNRNLTQGLTLYPSAAATHDRMRSNNDVRLGTDYLLAPQQ